MRKSQISIIIFILLIALIPGCNKSNEQKHNKDKENSIDLTTYAAKDDLGRVLPFAGDKDVPEYNANKQVGIFYFVWHGARQTPGPHDVSKIIEKDPDAARSDAAWIAAGGGNTGTNHWWGEPLFGYFRNTDRWVMTKDIQMLTDAGVDFVVFDYSNGNS